MISLQVKDNKHLQDILNAVILSSKDSIVAFADVVEEDKDITDELMDAIFAPAIEKAMVRIFESIGHIVEEAHPLLVAERDFALRALELLKTQDDKLEDHPR